ncbi:MAG: WYL domain-containing protein [Bacteroidetes bacterium]|nr:MAG: WYL domain-containing protein [Bacteroidota bacterium]
MIESSTHHVDEAEFLVIDVETTGLSPDKNDRVCEIAAIKVCSGAIIESFGTIVNPRRMISPGAFKVNQITNEMLATAPYFEDIADKLNGMLEGAIIAGYNVPFDVSFIQHEFRLCGFPGLQNSIVDVLPLARQLLPGLGKYPQENVARVVGIPFPVKHRALEDTFVTAQLLMFFIKLLKTHDMTTLSDLQRNDLKKILLFKRRVIAEEAIQSKLKLWIQYLSSYGNQISERIVSPKEIIEVKEQRSFAPYLLAYCYAAAGERNFRFDKILDIKVVAP